MKSIVEYIAESQVMSGYEISPYDSDKNNWRDCLTDAAYQLYLTADSNREVYDIVQPLIKSMLKKKAEDLSVEKLGSSSVMEKICSLSVKLLKKGGYDEPISAADRKQFKEFFAKKIIEVELDEFGEFFKK